MAEVIRQYFTAFISAHYGSSELTNCLHLLKLCKTVLFTLAFVFIPFCIIV